MGWSAGGRGAAYPSRSQPPSAGRELPAGGGSSSHQGGQLAVEMVYQFVVSLVEEQILSGGGYFPLTLTTLIFLLLTNLIGIIPYSFTATSHLAGSFGSKKLLD